MEIGAVEHIRTKASLVIQVIDDFTNRVISDGSVQVSIEGASKPIRKSEGYYIFLNLGMTQVNLTAMSLRYGTENRIINLSTVNEKEPMIKIRMKPNRNYSLPEGTTSVFGIAEPESEIRVTCDSVQKYYRLLYDYDRDKLKDEINIFNPDKTDLDGKVLMIRDKDDSVSEAFYIIGTKDRESGRYQIGSILKNNYKKEITCGNSQKGKGFSIHVN
jgi:hypothetical protein